MSDDLEPRAADDVEPGPPRKRRRRWLRRLLLLLLVLALGVGLTALLVLTRPFGLRALLDRAGPLIGGELTYAGTQGRLLDAWSVEDLRFRQLEDGAPTGLEVTVGRLAVRWRPMALTGAVLDLVSVEAEQVAVSTPPPPEPATPPELPDVRLPLTVRLAEARVTDLTVASADEPLRVDRIALRRLIAAPAGGPLAIERMAIATEAASLELGGTVRPVGDYAVALEAAWRATIPVAEGDPPLDVAGAGSIRGPVTRQLTIDQQVSARPEGSAEDAPSPIAGTVSGTLNDPLGEPALEVRVAWSRARWPFGGEPLVETQGEAQVSGDLERIEIDGSLQARGPRLPESELALRAVTDLGSLTAESLELRTLGSTITGSGTVDWRQGLTWSAALEGRDLDPSVRWPEWPGRLALAFDGSGTVDDEGTARTEATLDRIRGTLRGYPVDASGEVLVLGAQLESLLLEGRSGSATLRLAGSIRERADLDFEARVPDLAEVLPDAEGTVEAEGHLAGDRATPSLDVRLQASDGRWRDLRVASLNATLDGALAAGAEIRALVEVAGVESEIVDADEATLRLDGELGGLELDRLVNASRVDTRLSVSALRLGTIRASGVSLDVDGTLAEHELLLAADSAEQEGGQQAAQRLTVRAAGGASAVSLDGRWSGTLEELRLFAPGLGRWTLDSEVAVDLSRELVEVGYGCWRRTGGTDAEPSSVCGEARWSRVEPWSLRANVTAVPLGLFDPLLTSMVEPRRPECRDEDISLPCEDRPQPEPGPVRAATVDGQLDGALEASGVGPAIEAARVRITRLEGVLSAQLESGTLIDVPFRTQTGSLQLDGGTGLQAAARIALPDHDGLVSAQVELPGFAPAPGGWTPAGDQPLTGSLDATLRNAAFLEAFVPGLRDPRGQITAALELTGTADRASLDGSIRVSGGSGRVVFEDRAAGTSDLELAFADGEVDATLGRSGVQIDLSVRSVDPAGRAAGRIELPGYRLLSDEPLSEERVSGRVEVTLDGIAPLAELLPQLAEMKGTVDGAFTLGGTVGAPDLDGRADLREFSASVPDLALRLSEGTATVSGTLGRGLEVSASVRSGPGTLRATGTVSTGESGWSTELKLSGSDVTVADTPEIRLRASPDLTVVATPEVVDVQGEVVLPWARIVLRDLPEQAIEPSADIVRVDRPLRTSEDSPTPRTRVTGRIRLVLGDDFEFEGFGFDIEPSGSLLISETGRGSTTATGQLLLGKGEYRAYGRSLDITEGRMLFGGGPIQNPALAVEAYRTVGTVQAGVRVSGNLTQPIVHLASSPAMPESDILQYLVLGRPPGKITSAAEADLLADAAVALGIGGGNLLARKLAARYDLDQLGIETDGNVDSAALVVGKYLSPRLYVSYGIGLLEPISTITLRYILSSKWTLSAERGRGTGADLVYAIETGKRSIETEPP